MSETIMSLEVFCDSEISGSELHAIELNLPAGSYHVELTHPGGRQSERLIITN